MKQKTTNSVVVSLIVCFFTLVNHNLVAKCASNRNSKAERVSACMVSLLSPENNSVLPQRRVEGGKIETSWWFSWTGCHDTTRYHLYVIGPNARNPIVNIDSLQTNSYLSKSSHFGITDLQGWTWRVRALVNGVWGDWSETGTFHVSPVDEGRTPAFCSISGQVLNDKSAYRTSIILYQGDSKRSFDRRSVDSRGRYKFSRVPEGVYRVVPSGSYPGGKADIGPIPSTRRVQCESNGNHTADFRIGSSEG